VPGNGGIAVATTSSHSRSAPALISTGSECLVTWPDHTGAPTFVQAARIAPDGTLRSGAGCETRVGSTASESFVRVTATGPGAAWIDWFDGTGLQRAGARLLSGPRRCRPSPRLGRAELQARRATTGLSVGSKAVSRRSVIQRQ
jgi:hypothetical protein